MEGEIGILVDDGFDAGGDDYFRIELYGGVVVERVLGPIEVLVGKSGVEAVLIVLAVGGIKTDAQRAIEVVDIGGKDGLTDGECRVVSGAIVLAVSGHFAKVEAFLDDAAHEPEGQEHRSVVAEGFVVVEGRKQFGCLERCGAGLVIKDFERRGEIVIVLADVPFEFAVERAGAIGVSKAVPLVTVNALDTVVAGENARQRGVPEQRGFVELGEMDILCPGGGCQEEDSAEQI